MPDRRIYQPDPYHYRKHNWSGIYNHSGCRQEPCKVSFDAPEYTANADGVGTPPPDVDHRDTERQKDPYYRRRKHRELSD